MIYSVSMCVKVVVKDHSRLELDYAAPACLIHSTASTPRKIMKLHFDHFHTLRARDQTATDSASPFLFFSSSFIKSRNNFSSNNTVGFNPWKDGVDGINVWRMEGEVDRSGPIPPVDKRLTTAGCRGRNGFRIMRITFPLVSV